MKVRELRDLLNKYIDQQGHWDYSEYEVVVRAKGTPSMGPQSCSEVEAIGPLFIIPEDKLKIVK